MANLFGHSLFYIIENFFTRLFMRQGILFIISILLLAQAPLHAQTPNDAVHPPKALTLYFFGSPTCEECNEIKFSLLYPLMAEYESLLDVKSIDINSPSGNDSVHIFENHFKVVNTSPQELFFPDTFLTGFEDIMEYGEERIKSYLANSSKWTWAPLTEISKEEIQEKRKESVNSEQFWLITGAAIIDGVNPCAIATMIFLISFLTTRKKTKKEILVIGMAFTFTVFLTYFLLGYGLFGAIVGLSSYPIFSKIIKYLAITLAAGVSLFSFRDAYVFNKTGKSSEITLQLPKSIKLRIHKVISGNLKSIHIVWGAIITGFLVTLLEAVCTGQVYLPAITAMARTESTAFEGLIWLVYYCLIFVAPLFLVMIAAYKGLTWENLAKMTQKRLTLIKVLIGIIMGALAIYLW